MAPHSSTLAWKIPWMEEPGRLHSMGSLRVRHDWATSLSLFTFMHWRRKWQPTPVFLPGESQGWGSLVGCCLWGLTESDTTEATQQQQHTHNECLFQWKQIAALSLRDAYVYIFSLCGASLYAQVNPCPWDSYIKLESPLLLPCLAKPSPTKHMKHKGSLAWDTI